MLLHKTQEEIHRIVSPSFSYTASGFSHTVAHSTPTYVQNARLISAVVFSFLCLLHLFIRGPNRCGGAIVGDGFAHCFTLFCFLFSRDSPSADGVTSLRSATRNIITATKSLSVRSLARFFNRDLFLSAFFKSLANFLRWSRKAWRSALSLAISGTRVLPGPVKGTPELHAPALGSELCGFSVAAFSWPLAGRAAGEVVGSTAGAPEEDAAMMKKRRLTLVLELLEPKYCGCVHTMC